MNNNNNINNNNNNNNNNNYLVKQVLPDAVLMLHSAISM